MAGQECRQPPETHIVMIEGDYALHHPCHPAHGVDGIGYAVASFSFSWILSFPVFRSWSVSHGYTKTLRLSVSLLCAGTLMYAQVVNVGVPKFLILAQTVLGVGSRTPVVTWALVADVTPNRNRTTYMVWLTAVRYAGFTVTPVFGAIFAKIFSNGREISAGLFVLNQFMAPAYFITTICIFTIVIMAFYFRHRHQS